MLLPPLLLGLSQPEKAKAASMVRLNRARVDFSFVFIVLAFFCVFPGTGIAEADVQFAGPGLHWYGG